MKELQLTTGETVLLDDEDYEKVRESQWKLITNSAGMIRILRVIDLRALDIRLFGFLGPKARPVFRDGNPLNYQRDNVIMSYRGQPINARALVQIKHCPWGRCSIHPAGTVNRGHRSTTCLRCMNIQYKKDDFQPYKECMNLAADRNWPGWAREDRD
jgi:hypothetical protein